MNGGRLLAVAFAAVLIGGGAYFLFGPQPVREAAGGMGEGAAAQGGSGAGATAGGGEAAALAEVLLPEALGDSALIGERIFNAKCAACHNRNAAGREGVAPPLVHQIYRPAHHGDAAFLLAVRNGVRAHHWNFGNMPPVEGLTDADVRYVVAYIRELQRANGVR